MFEYLFRHVVELSLLRMHSSFLCEWPDQWSLWAMATLRGYSNTAMDKTELKPPFHPQRATEHRRSSWWMWFIVYFPVAQSALRFEGEEIHHIHVTNVQQHPFVWCHCRQKPFFILLLFLPPFLPNFVVSKSNQMYLYSPSYISWYLKVLYRNPA
jgi:hypothetical protein